MTRTAIRPRHRRQCLHGVTVKSERLGLTMIAATLVVIAVSVALYVHQHREARSAQLASQGSALAGVLARMPMGSLTARDGRQGPLDLLASTADGSDLAYAVVSGADGAPRAQVSRVTALPPPGDVSDPAEWFGTRAATAADGRRYQEHFAPVLEDGRLAGHVRVGFAEPGFDLLRGEMRAVAALALLIFALVPIFYYLVRREVQPLRALGEEVRKSVDNNPLWAVNVGNPEDLREFVASFNRLVRAADERMRTLDDERTHVLTHSRVLSYEKARIESVLQSMPDGVLVLDESGSVTYVNDKLGPMLGLESGALVGESPAEWAPFPELTAFLNGASTVRGKTSASGSLEIPAADGKGRIAVTAYPLFSPRERLEVLGTLVVFSDITAEVLAKQARKDLVAQLSHELKTPLHVIGMYSEMLLEDGVDAEAIRIEAGNVIHDEVERVSALITNMLSISRIEMGSVQLKRRRTRLGDLLQDALDAISRSGSGRDLSFSLQVPPDLSAVNVDKDLMRVAINNLLTNAIKYNSPSGSVVLGAEESDDEIAVFVRDTGPGIPEDDRERIFERFYRGANGENSEVSGHGLGLPLTREIVHVHLGEIDVDSTPGKGSEFRIRLRKTATLLKEAV